MSIPNRIPESWIGSAPRLLVVGEGVYARALAQVLGAATLEPKVMLADPAPNEDGAYPRVLGYLERVFLLAGTSVSAADLLRLHDAIWNWVERLSPEGDQHELAILFVVPPAGDGFGDALAAGLGLESFASDVPGHGLARMDDSLTDLLAKAVAIVPQDLTPLRARQTADLRHAALHDLRQAATEDALVTAALRVSQVFLGKEYLLDLFCRPPSHRNGNQLRTWLNGIVTGSVTPYDKSAESLLDWLDDSKFL